MKNKIFTRQLLNSIKCITGVGFIMNKKLGKATTSNIEKILTRIKTK